jgi:hypothetical protein
VWALLKGAIELGAAFEEMPELDVTPVDYVARAIVRLSLSRAEAAESPPPGPFHFANPRPLPWREVFDTVESLGYGVRRLPYRAWRRELGEVAARGGDNALLPFLPLLPELPPAAPGEEEAPPEIARVRYDDRRARALLERPSADREPVRCPPLDAALLRTYLDHFIASGYLPPPTPAPRPAGTTSEPTRAPGRED